MIHYIFLSYILYPFLFALQIYVRGNNTDINGKRITYWRWVKVMLGDFWKGRDLLLWLFSPLFVLISIYTIITRFKK